MDFKNKRVLVAGGTGMVGIQLVELLIREGAKVRIASLDDPSRAHPDAEFLKLDLTNYSNCLLACGHMDYVFNLLCAKGSPDTVNKYPATLMRPMILFNTYLIDAAWQSGAEGFLYTSSIGVYHQTAKLNIYNEDDIGLTPPPKHDFAGRAKLFGEWYAQAMAREHNWNVAIVRPSNIYGPYDNFDARNASVIPSLIKRALTEKPLIVWGDGSPIRDFIYANDVARGILLVAKSNPDLPVNIGSGVGVPIRSLVQTIIDCIDKDIGIVWDLEKPNGDAMRLLDTTRASVLGFKPIVNLELGIRTTIEWYLQNQQKSASRYDIFNS